MAKQTNLLLAAVLLAAGAWAANAPSVPVSATATKQTAPCQNAILQNGFTLEHVRVEVTGDTTRLWLCASATGYLDLQSDQIARFEKETPIFTPTNTQNPNLNSIPNLIADAARRHQIDPDFIASVVKAESAFNPNAVSPKGAMGLMQLMPGTAASMGVGNVFDPAANVEGGTKYLRELLDYYHGDAIKALAAYNAGPKQVQRYGDIPPFPETRNYVTRVIKDFNRKKAAVRAQ